MATRQQMIYIAATRERAENLRQMLEEAGISAALIDQPVTPTPLQSGAEGAIGVAVDREEVAKARQIVLEFDQHSKLVYASNVAETSYVPELGRVLDAWPTCPGCARPRQTVCPVCETAGSNFKVGTDPDRDDATDDHTDRWDDAPGANQVICPTCDESFAPKYLRRCEWCGHDFLTGIEPPVREEEIGEPLHLRIGFVVAVLLAMFGGAFWLLMRASGR